MAHLRALKYYPTENYPPPAAAGVHTQASNVVASGMKKGDMYCAYSGALLCKLLSIWKPRRLIYLNTSRPCDVGVAPSHVLPKSEVHGLASTP